MALLAANVDGTDGQVCILSEIANLPPEILNFIRKRVPTFKLRQSKMAGSKYYGNTCPDCGVLYGDFFLHSEPGAVFFPTDEEDAKSLYLREIPLPQPVKVSGGSSRIRNRPCDIKK